MPPIPEAHDWVNLNLILSAVLLGVFLLLSLVAAILSGNLSRKIHYEYDVFLLVMGE